MLQEIVILRKKNDALECQLTSLEARLSLAYQELAEVANEALSK